MATPALASPCRNEIDGSQAAFDNQLDVDAANGPSGVKSTAATLNHQPTPQPLAAAEAQLDDISARQAQSFVDALQRARKADDAGDEAVRRASVADALKILPKISKK